MILAAGLGTRLRPLTDKCPKPLVPFFGVPLLYILLEQVAALAPEEIFVNGHHLPEQVKNAISSYPLTVNIRFSFEKEILGTAGAFYPIKQHLKNHDLLVINGDIVSDFDLPSLIAQHQQEGPIATMGLLSNPHPGKTLVWHDRTRILGIGGEKPHIATHGGSFAGVQVLSEEFLHLIKDHTHAESMPIYQRLIKEGKKISHLSSNPFWYDIGCFQDYYQAHAHALASLQDLAEPLALSKVWKNLGIAPEFYGEGAKEPAQGFKPPYFNSKSVKLGEGTQLGPLAFNMSALDKIPDGISISQSILLPGAVLEPGMKIKNMIISKNALISIT